ncbi:MAG: MATE family efflux transporter [Eubacterium sp.]|nr:MATE family efflux transporter [Eubacterium sp.]MDD7209104.1 MATE family efflux transporter [Lachnospiraceae bacterium]MDY5498241.1 MATE family efflux transporter [Anaerobutyricum sp.]
MDQSYMKEKPILPLLLSMAAPMVLSMLVNSLYNIIDSIFVAKISEDAMTALSLVYPVQNLINSIAVGFGIGINVRIAFCLGANAREKADHAASQGMFLSIVHGMILCVLGFVFMPFFLKIFTDDPKLISLGLNYSNIVLIFSAVITLEVAFEKYFQAMGMMVISMISMTGGCILNIILDPILIFGAGPVPAFGIRGAAWATGIGQCFTLALYLFFYIKKKLPVKIHIGKIRPDLITCKKLYGVGIPATLNMALPSVLISCLNGILAAISQSGVIILGIYYKLQTFLYLPANGMIQGMRPLMGYNFGAGQKERVIKIYRVALGIAAFIMAVGTALCVFIPNVFIEMFTSNPATVTAGSSALHIICAGFLVSSVSVVSSGALEALGKGTASLLVSLLRFILLIIPIAFLLSRFFGTSGVWHAFWITEFITAAASCLIFQKTIQKTR